MKKLHTVTLPKQDASRRPAKARPATALVTSVLFHALLIGILVLIPYTIHSQRNTPVPTQFTLHYSNDEDLPTEILDPQPVDEPIISQKALPQAIQLIPKIVISHLSPSLPTLTISATFAQSEKADSLVETFSPSLDFPKSPTETVKKPNQRSSSPPSHSSGLIAARPLKRHAPNYPNLARKKGYQGTSIFIATINPDGTIKNLQLSKTSGHAILDKAAKEALRHWKFTPAKRNGITVASQLRIPIVFRLG